jgi:magnesium transporter
MKYSTRTGLLDALRERRRFPRQRKPGDVPGALVFEGSQRVDEVKVDAIDYGPKHFTRTSVPQLSDCARFLGADNPTWLHVTGLHDIETISHAGKLFDIPDLLLEDLLNTGGRPKMEQVEDAIFIQLKILEEVSGSGELDLQQLSIFLSEKTIITFCEDETNVFDPIFRRLKNAKGRLRNRSLDYLLWAILDTVIDHALSALHLLEKNLIDVDELIQEDHTDVTASELYSLKHEIMSIQHFVRPNREIIHAVRQSPSDLISDDLAPFLDDLRDHSMALSDECDALREYAAGIREYLLAELNQRMNNVMKVLTCISTIFLPLTFLAGIYGMNFAHMPELQVPWAYPVLWIVFLGVGGFLVFLFRKKKWL